MEAAAASPRPGCASLVALSVLVSESSLQWHLHLQVAGIGWQGLIESCMVRMQAFTSLAAKALAAELPGHDLLNAFSLFNCHGRSARLRDDDVAAFEANKIKSAERLAKVFKVEVENLYNEHLDHEGIALYGARSRNLSNFEAWKSAVLRTRSRRSTREAHPSDSLLRVLIRYGAFTGATTSGVEQSFSRLEKHISSNKRCMKWERELDEAKLVLDHDSAQEGPICQAARQIWLQYSPQPRTTSSKALGQGRQAQTMRPGPGRASWQQPA